MAIIVGRHRSHGSTGSAPDEMGAQVGDEQRHGPGRFSRFRIANSGIPAVQGDWRTWFDSWQLSGCLIVGLSGLAAPGLTPLFVGEVHRTSKAAARHGASGRGPRRSYGDAVGAVGHRGGLRNPDAAPDVDSVDVGA
jgi:hypothetical protein